MPQRRGGVDLLVGAKNGAGPESRQSVVGVVAVWSLARPAPARVAPFDVSPRDEITIVRDSGDVAVSPDSEYIAFVTGGTVPVP